MNTALIYTYMAEGYTSIYLNIGVAEMARLVGDMVDKYDVDGLVMHSNRNRKPYFFGQYDIRKIVRDGKDIPSLILEADMRDERNFSESQIKTCMEAFIEMLKHTQRQ